MLYAKSWLSYSGLGVLILLPYLHERIQPELPEHGHPPAQPLLHQPAGNHDEEEAEEEGLQKLA